MSDPVLDYLSPRQMALGPQNHADKTFDHWTLARDAHDVAWAVLDVKGASANTLSEGVLEELDRLLDQVENKRPRALVFRSSKPSGFLAGADISEFRGVADEEAIRTRIGAAHAVVDRIEDLKIPTIAVMHGYAMGGGLEIALACSHRIAVEGARFGFPEVKLGLHPGLGGTARFVRQVDPLKAMQAMLTGRTVNDRQAKELGLVDALVPERHVRVAVRAAVKGELPQSHHGVVDRLKETGAARRIAAKAMRAEAEKQAPKAHYPAPHALIDLWEQHGDSFAQMKQAEIESFTRLMLTDTAQNLIRVFFLREKLKKLAGDAEHGVRHVHVIGAGAMGADIAAWCAWQGFRTSLADVKSEPIGKAVKRAAELYEKIARGDGIKIRDALDRLVPDPSGEGVRIADLIIEAAPEKIDIKRKLYADIEPQMKSGAILATNTSAIPLDELAGGLKRPERFVGIHFFNPVSRLELVEVISHDRLDRDVEARARAFAGGIDKLPAPAIGKPGFIVNRALTPYLLEAMILLDEGVPKEAIDQAAIDFGMPVGPLELADQVGLDVGLEVARMLKRELRWPVPDPPAWLRQKVEKGELGKKTGKGIYDWKDGEPVKADKYANPPQDITDRLILPVLNTAAGLLREGVTDDPDIVDAAMIFATGFAPFRGGPIHYAKARGVGDVRERLLTLAETHGDRFLPDEGWDRIG